MIRVYLCSPYQGDVDANVALARSICAELTRNGCAVLAPHLLYPQFLDDTDPAERERGLQAAAAWIPVCNVMWVYKGRNMGEGMIQEISEAHSLNVPIIEQRHLSDFETPFRELANLLEKIG